MKGQFRHEKLRELRKAKGLNQEDVAAALGVVRQTYSNYETGLRIPSVKICKILAELFKMSADELMEILIVSDNEELDSCDDEKPASFVDDYLQYLNNHVNQRRLKHLSSSEKEIVYFFGLLRESDRNEILEIIKLKLRNY